MNIIKDKKDEIKSEEPAHEVQNPLGTGNRLTELKPEVLAPAGREDVFHAVFEAGADAVYMSGKQFNMRRHRKDYHFTEEQVKRLTGFAHDNGKKIYITVNSLVAETEIRPLLEYLKHLEAIGVDAVIVQDFSVVNIVQENGISIPLHSSTMMNVNCADYAAFLKSNGFTRVVTSRDITVEDVRKIGEEAKIETEYFLHGDMCSVQSGQCYGSGIIFGKSSNRGQCMKLCRWAYDMVTESNGQKIAEDAYLLATKDLCLLQQIPELVNAGISSLKIEGRMKSAEQLSRIVSMYRHAVDLYCDTPLSYSRNAEETGELYRNRVRNLSTGFAFQTPADEYFDLPGEREPMFLSYAGQQAHIKEWNKDFFESSSPDSQSVKVIPEISVVAGDKDTALSAMENGADNIILSWEGGLTAQSLWRNEDIDSIFTAATAHDARVILETAKIMTEREMNELRTVIDIMPQFETFSITSPAPLRLLSEYGKKIWVSYNCNLLNSESFRFYRKNGCERFAPSLESSFTNIKNVKDALPDIPVELPAHGAITSMLVEHCLIAMHTQHISKKEFCKMPCIYDSYSIIDKRGRKRKVVADRYCRNHIMMEFDLCILPSLRSFLSLNPASFRIDARLYSVEETAFLTRLYKNLVKDPGGLDEKIMEFRSFYGEDTEFSYGAYAKGISRDSEISLLGLKQAEKKSMEVDRESNS